MTTSNSKPPPAPLRKLVLRRIPERPALPVVRPPPRPSDVSVEAARRQAGSLPPVAATWPPPFGEPPGGAAGGRAWANPMWIASGAAAIGAAIAMAAALTVPPGSPAKAAAAVQVRVRATPPSRTSEQAGHPAHGSTPWVEVPVYSAAVTSAIPASALPLARPSAAPKALPRTATTLAPIPSASSAPPAPAESASGSVEHPSLAPSP